MGFAQIAKVLDASGQSLHFSQGLLAATLENIDVGVSVVDRDLRLVAWNSRYLDLFDYPPGLIRGGVPVADLISERMMLTIIMETCTIIFIWVVSFVIGVYAATHQYKLGDYVASFIGFIGLSIPNFLLALVLLYVGKVYFGLSIGGLFAASVYPISLGVLHPPGAYGADVAVAEGRCLGSPIAYGGPGLGLLTTTEKILGRSPNLRAGWSY